MKLIRGAGHIAQSREAKGLGIKMAGPWFEVEELPGQQTDLLGFSDTNNRSCTLMENMDSINRKYYLSSIHLASEGAERTWSMRRSFQSQNFTGDWNGVDNARSTQSNCARSYAHFQLRLNNRSLLNTPLLIDFSPCNIFSKML